MQIYTEGLFFHRSMDFDTAAVIFRRAESLSDEAHPPDLPPKAPV
jgi:hypothetical protein